ncbi:type II toxin-antitoxin system ParD family antitoxin [Sphingomonas sp. ID1715]|uniref:type II toxin-antitoxin system ParD family antitoxin n=1 Tax=Sphingomonas sp. ID1715 TaxID=1656898 RepID=UPI001488D03B|nr:type II toxin-antitoxin system ParD family antitoxin [Sphingomonas sp. ID1715]NNM75329.1 type II toxin-antitoxin system ParD family antitoxin [Sphingomonas sp. ID1715]
MPQINVSVPEGLKDWIEHQIGGGRYSSASDYIRELLRNDERRAQRLATLQAAIDEGRASGPAREYKQVFDDLRRKRSEAA